MFAIIINFLIFQAGWFITVYSAASGLPWYGPLFTLSWLIVHLTFFTERRIAEVNILIFAAILGYVFDSVQVYMSTFSFPTHTVLGSPSTLWMVALWINLAATLNLSLKWLEGRYVLAALLGFIGGPAAYYGGSKFGAIYLPEAWSLLAIATQWMIAMPLLFWVKQRISVNRNTVIC